MSRTMVKSLKVATGVVVTGTMIALAGSASADQSTCASLMRSNLEQELKAIDPSLSADKLCSRASSDRRSSKTIGNLSATELKASRDLLCGRSALNKQAKAQQRSLRSLIGNSLLREHEQCLALAERGAHVQFAAPTVERNFTTIAIELDNPEVTLREVSVEPQGSLLCEGFAALGGASSSQNLWGRCEPNPAAPAPVSIIRVRLSRGLLNIKVSNHAVTANTDALAGARWNHEALPNIPHCRVLSVADRILSCWEPLGQNLCYRELRAGNLLDCRSEVAARIYPNRAERQIRYATGEYALAPRGSMAARVYRNRPDEGRISGYVEYTANFSTPVLRERSANHCDRSCPLFGGEQPCNRDCVFADHVLETEAAFGVLQLTREAGDSCEAPLTGRAELSPIDAYRAYNLCESRNAWGNITTGMWYGQVSKYYYFNDYRTRHVEARGVRNGEAYTYERWELTNEGERVRSIGALEIPFMIYCDE